MGARGPRPKSAAIKEAEGNLGHRKKTEPAQLTAAGDRPSCPAWLSLRAKREWRRVLPVLLRAGLVREEDYMQLAALVQAFSTMADAQEQLNQQVGSNGLAALTIKVGDGGYIQENPLLTIIRKQEIIVSRISQAFGMNAASRARLTGEEAQPMSAAGVNRIDQILNDDRDEGPCPPRERIQ